MKTPLLSCALAATMGLLYAATSSAQNAPPAGKNPALDAAIQACAASVAKDAGGHPDRTAMDACMTAKGFTKPSGAPPKQN